MLTYFSVVKVEYSSTHLVYSILVYWRFLLIRGVSCAIITMKTPNSHFGRIINIKLPPGTHNSSSRDLSEVFLSFKLLCMTEDDFPQDEAFGINVAIARNSPYLANHVGYYCTHLTTVHVCVCMLS